MTPLLKPGSLSSVLFLVLTGVLAVVFVSCENPEGALNGNSAPDTRIANVPVNDTIALYIDRGAIPQQTLYWVGDDPDGFLIGFRYTWTDIYDGTENPTDTINILNLATIAGLTLDTLATIPDITLNSPGAMFRIYNYIATLDPEDAVIRTIRDSLLTLRPFLVPYPSGYIATDWLQGADPLFLETPNKGIFLFDSPADSNMHRFEVWSIDNNEVIDPTPAKVHFWTLESPGLTVSISGGPTTASAAYVLRYPTERTPGFSSALQQSTRARMSVTIRGQSTIQLTGHHGTLRRQQPSRRSISKRPAVTRTRSSCAVATSGALKALSSSGCSGPSFRRSTIRTGRRRHW